jgi:hypothetical protein
MNFSILFYDLFISFILLLEINFKLCIHQFKINS